MTSLEQKLGEQRTQSGKSSKALESKSKVVSTRGPFVVTVVCLYMVELCLHVTGKDNPRPHST